MSSLNKVMLIGNVGNDPEIRDTSTGTRIAKLSLATNRKWRSASGQQAEKTEWHRLTVFGKLVDVIEKYVKKGDRLYVEGRVEYSKTEGKDGTKYWTDIVVQEMVMLGGRDREPVGATAAPASFTEPDDTLPF